MSPQQNQSPDPEAEQTDPHVTTRVIRGRAAAGSHREQVTPIYMSSGFTFDSAEQAQAVYAGEQPGYVYTRWENPNTDELVERLCALEGAEAGIPVASGMAAIFTVLAGLLNSGDHVLASRALFGATHQVMTTILPRWGISHTYADGDGSDGWASLFRPETRLCLIETPSNPGLMLIDLARLAGLCRDRDVVLVVDNTFATPVIQQPVSLGADLVIHSTTKFIDGQGRTIGGVVLGDRFLIDQLTHFTRQTGPTLSPFNGWILSQALETLPLRMARHCENALALAQWLEQQPGVAAVRYPFLESHPQHELALQQMSAGGGIVTFELDGGVEAGRRFLNALQMCDIVANLGDSRTTVTHPTGTTHSGLTEEERRAVGITPGLIRVSVGLEYIDDINADIAQALMA
jgi:O-succinylhomoserine sulfhydrylase